MDNKPASFETQAPEHVHAGFRDTLHDIHAAAYREWKLQGRHYEEYACEFVGTALLVIAVVGAVAVVQATGSPVAQAIKQMPFRLLLTGFCIAACSLFITISPLGRLSGAHLNPAISLGFWMLGKLGARDMTGYMASQMSGGLAGALVAKPLFGMLGQQVNYAALAPGPHVDIAAAFCGEFLCTFIMAVGIYYFVSHAQLARWTPFMLLGLIPFLVLSDATVSGCGMDPARWIGPAWVAHIWQSAWIYIVAPLGGASLAVMLRKWCSTHHQIPVTAKLFHDHNFRSIFRHDQMPTKPPAGTLEKSD